MDLKNYKIPEMGVGALHKHRGNGPSTTGRKVQDHPQTLDNNFCFLPASAKKIVHMFEKSMKNP